MSATIRPLAAGSRAAREDRPRAWTNLATRRKLIDAEITNVAIQLFTAKGYASTTLQDIARATGLSRPALYNYVKNKEDILARLVEEFTVSNAAQHSQILADTGLSPVEKLAAIVSLTARSVAQRPLHFRLLDRCENELPEAVRKRNLASKRAVRDAFVAVLDEGCASGQLRCSDTRLAAFSLIAMCTWIAWWLPPSDEADVERTVRDVTELALRSVAATCAENQETGVKRNLIGEISDRLDLLKRELDRDGR